MIYTIFFQQLLYGILALFITYAIGKVILSCFTFKGDYFFRLFVTNIVGITAIVMLYSLLKSQGKTINTVLLPILFFFLYSFKKTVQKPTFNFKEITKDCGWILLVFLLFFMYQSFFYFDMVNGEIKTLYIDYYWYGSITDSLKLWGSETQFTEMSYFFIPFRNGLMPYHYFELWFTAFFSYYFKISSLNSYYFITTTILSSVFLIGIMQLLSKVLKKIRFIVPIAIVFLFISGMHFRFLDHFEWFKYSFIFSDRSILTLAASKSLIILIFVLLFYQLYKQAYLQPAYAILLAIPVLSFTFLPMIYGGILLFVVLNLITNRFKIKRNDLYLFLAVLLHLLFIMVFYSLFQSGYTNDYAFKQIFKMGIFKGITNNAFSFLNGKIILSNFIVFSIPYIVTLFSTIAILYSPFLLLGFSHIKTNKAVWILLFCMLLSGTIGSVFTKGLLDSIQFTSNFCGILMVFCIIATIESIPFYKLKSKQTKYIVVCLFLFSILHCYSIKNAIILRNNSKYFLTENKKMIPEIASQLPSESCVIGIFLSQNDYSSRSFLSWYESNDLFRLNQLTNNAIVFTLLNPELVLNNTRTLNYDESSYLHFYTPFSVSDNKGQSLQQFTENNKIHYFYCKAGVTIPPFIVAKAKKIIVSNATHNQFIITN